MAVSYICRLLAGFLLFYNAETGYELFSIGCQLELDGKIEEALVYYERARRLSPDSPEIYTVIANALFKIREFDQGIKYCKEGLRIAPDNDDLYYTLAIGYIGKGDLKSAVVIYERLLEKSPQDIELYNSLSILYEATGEFKKASGILLNMPDTLKNSDIFVRLGALAGKENDHTTALTYYRRAFTMDTTNVTALVGLGTGYDLLNVKDSAIYYYEKSLIEDSLLLTVGKRLVELYSDTEQYRDLIKIAGKILEREYKNGYIRRSLGFSLYKMGMFKEALQEFLLASRLDPDDTYSRFYIGRIYLEDGDYEAAVKEIEDALKVNPDFIELWIYLGFIAIDIKDFKTARHAFSEAAHRGGDLIQVYYLLGVVSEMERRYTDAYYNYKKALKYNPDDLSSLEALANLCERLGRKDEAFRTFHKIIEIDTTNAVALNYVGYTLAEQNDSLEYALELINRALVLEGDNAYYLDSRGWVFYQMGRYEAALEELKKAAQLAEDAIIFEHLGDIYMKLNDPTNAATAYQRALEQDPQNQKIRKKLEQLNK